MNSDADSNTGPRRAPEAAATAGQAPAEKVTGTAALDLLRAAPDRQALFLDVDGTLLPIAPHPDAVRVGTALLDLLRRLDARLDGALALVSGRSIANLDTLFAPLRLPCAGVHGLEHRSADGTIHCGRTAAQLDPLRDSIAAYVARHPGLLLEDKRRSLALHFRGAPQYEAEAEVFLREEVAATAPALELTHGKMVLEVKPAGANKGTAIEAFLREPPFSGRQPVFIGDDVTDEDGFAMVNAQGGLSIRVGSPRAGAAERSAAVHCLADEAAVLAWLAGWLDGDEDVRAR